MHPLLLQTLEIAERRLHDHSISDSNRYRLISRLTTEICPELGLHTSVYADMLAKSASIEQMQEFIAAVRCALEPRPASPLEKDSIMKNPYRAAYIAADADSTGGGIVLTTEEQSHLPDAELLEAARAAASDADAQGEILIGEWRD